MKKITIITLLLCAMHTQGQVKIENGGNVFISSPFNPTVYAVLGNSNRLFGSKFSIYGYRTPSLAIDHIGTPDVNYQWSSIVSVDNSYTKNQIVDHKYSLFGLPKNSHNFFVYGNGIVWTKWGFVKFSDSNYKFDVQPISAAMTKIQGLNGVSYRLKPYRLGFTIDSTNQDSFTSQKKQIGFIAQQVETVLPEVVYKTSPDSSQTDSEKGIDYTA
ncbi:MAG: tail fiber domain-containing protein [Bacteroidota bacterium]|nr:tail fiber domain-containing protein [Bacteroidota bacterium]